MLKSFFSSLSKPSYIGLGMIYFLAVTSGLFGLDFGTHWDEYRIVNSVIETFRTGRPFPGWYNYPSVSYDIVLTVGFFQKIKAVLENAPQSFIFNELNSNTFYLNVRAVFLFITLLSIIWTFILVKIWQGNNAMALFAAGVVAGSWELAYHARWIAPDGLLVQFGVLTILLTLISIKRSDKKSLSWLVLASISAGLTMGTKYYGGIYILPVAIGFIHYARSNGLKIKSIALHGILLSISFILAFLLTTPGALFEPTKFVEDIQLEVFHYQLGHFAHDVSPGFDHASRLLAYLGMVILSPYRQIALALSLLVFIGLYDMRRDGIKALVFLCVPVFYLPYISMQHVMIVRNDLLLLPFLAILSTRGAASIAGILQRSTWKWGLIGILVTFLAANQVFLFQAATSIYHRKSIFYRPILLKHIAAHSNLKYYLAPDLKESFSSKKLSGFDNITDEIDQANLYVDTLRNVDEAFDWEGSGSNFLGSNWPMQYIDITGPFDVNINYYPDWLGKSRVVAIPMPLAIKLGLIKP